MPDSFLYQLYCLYLSGLNDLFLLPMTVAGNDIFAGWVGKESDVDAISLGNAVELEAEQWVEVTVVNGVTGVCENPALPSLNSS